MRKGISGSSKDTEEGKAGGMKCCEADQPSNARQPWANGEKRFSGKASPGQPDPGSQRGDSSSEEGSTGLQSVHLGFSMSPSAWG